MSKLNYFMRMMPKISGNRELRAPQVAAYIKSKEYFDSATLAPEAGLPAALITIPTGVGKSGIIAMLPFGIAAKSVLVVSPNLIILDTLAIALDSGRDSFLVSKKIVTFENRPRIFNVRCRFLNVRIPASFTSDLGCSEAQEYR